MQIEMPILSDKVVSVKYTHILSSVVGRPKFAIHGPFLDGFNKQTGSCTDSILKVRTMRAFPAGVVLAAE